MTSRRIIAAVAAVLLAVLGTAAVFAYVRGADDRAVAGQESVTVYIAQREVPVGTSFKDAVDQDMISEQTVAAKGVPAAPEPTISPTSQDLVAVTAISPGEMVLSGRFAAQGATASGLSIPDGDVAVSVALGDPAHVGPYLKPGAEIAIFDTFNVANAVGPPTPAGDHLQDDHARTRATRLLLSGVKVLAVGAQTQAATDDTSQSSSSSQSSSNQASGPLQVTLFTVAVTQAQAEVLIHGIQTGTLYLALMTDSSKVTAGPGVDDRHLFDGR